MITHDQLVYLGDSLKVFTPIAITVFGSIIAWRQYKTALAKLNYDLFDRRFKVYQATQDMIAATELDFLIDQTAVRHFNMDALNVSPFLFEPEMTAYLKGLLRIALDLRANTKLTDAATQSGDLQKKTALNGNEIKLLEEFNESTKHVVARFQKYMNLSKL